MNPQNGKRVRIGKNVKFEVDELIIGDGVYIGDNVVIQGPKVSIGDYTLIRENTQILGKNKCEIGMCCWIGQGVILDATDSLKIGNGVGIGAHSQLWTHIKFGDTLQGCVWENSKPMIVEDDVWFVGHCLVSPIHASAKSMAMLGSVVTQNMAPNRVYAGTPAKDITEKIGTPYLEVSVEKKYEVMKEKLSLFSEKKELDGQIEIVTEWPQKMDSQVTYFNVATREYTKRLSEIEIDFMLFLLVPIKFYPASFKIGDNR